ncbi:hypothetical protein ATCV1_z829L [Acanthocystis turfacea chlorella virus 1]|uniref:Uncharacterized protein z829L n=1 Tax=Chlorovirus heliozoae TaxID=322019 RepID=A7KA89_9PHYC|nr:hypothetical protein ATCV1_z829L [Acanthocystis turfacea chlorella virus 1]ABT16963.1 hypothetical protein ATCV1_z829L [Acanthocystis turfacea chlorella virus 1]
MEFPTGCRNPEFSGTSRIRPLVWLKYPEEECDTFYPWFTLLSLIFYICLDVEDEGNIHHVVEARDCHHREHVEPLDAVPQEHLKESTGEH